jgi:PAS domain S-box-containing protein
MLLEKTFASLDQAVFVIDPATRTILTCNITVERVFGYRPEEAIGRNAAFLHVNQEEYEDFGRAYFAALDKEGAYHTEQQLRRKDGATFFAAITMTEIVDHTGRRINLVCVVRDITECKQMERELNNRADDLRALNQLATVIGASFSVNDLLNNVLDLVLGLLHLQVGAIQLYDAEKADLVFGIQRGLSPAMIAEMQKMNIGESFPGRAFQSDRLTIREPETSGMYFGVEFKHASLYPCISVPLKSKDKPNGVLTLFGCGPRTLTVQGAEFVTAVANQLGVAIEHIRLAERAEEADVLNQVERLRSELITNVSHELRTPLGLIKLYSTTLLADDVEFSRATHREFLSNINHETDRLEKIVDSLFDGLRLQARQLRLEKRETDLGELARRVVAATQPQSAQHQIVCSMPAQLIASVDAKRIEQVLRNLLINAIKYSPNGGTIAVEGCREENYILMQVSDQGIGIPPTQLERVFERFYRTAGDLAIRVGGLGLGLAICRGIVEAHGGKIWVTSTVNRGSTFYFTLPIAE